MTIKSLIPAIIFSALAGCTQAGYYSGFDELNPGGWAYNDTVTFITDSCVASSMMIALRHNDSYPYKNIWLEISDSTRRDSVNIELCDIYGRWYGKGIGSSYQIAAPIPFQLKPNEPLHVRHILRVDTIRGIERIGLIPQP